MKSGIHLLPMMLAGVLFGCAPPAQRFEEHAGNLGFSSELIETQYFNHRIYFNGQQSGGILHVYLDGDGTPWRRRRVAEDPTSRNPLILELMKQDSAPAIMLGRPCYHAAGPEEACHFRYWTSHRYAKDAVNSLVQALRQWVAIHGAHNIVLIGYSGGGALAALMAPRIPEVALIVTVAGNLDVAGWNALHGYPPFNDSLNPLDYATAISHIRQIHFSGGEDRIVPISLIRNFAAKSAQARIVEYPDFDHVCCWLDEWRAILIQLSSEQTSWSKN